MPPLVMYYLAREGQSFGPYAEADLKAYVDAGNIAEDDMIFCEGWTASKPISQVFPNWFFKEGDLGTFDEERLRSRFTERQQAVARQRGFENPPVERQPGAPRQFADSETSDFHPVGVLAMINIAAFSVTALLDLATLPVLLGANGYLETFSRAPSGYVLAAMLLACAGFISMSVLVGTMFLWQRSVYRMLDTTASYQPKLEPQMVFFGYIVPPINFVLPCVLASESLIALNAYAYDRQPERFPFRAPVWTAYAWWGCFVAGTGLGLIPMAHLHRAMLTPAEIALTIAAYSLHALSCVFGVAVAASISNRVKALASI